MSKQARTEDDFLLVDNGREDPVSLFLPRPTSLEQAKTTWQGCTSMERKNWENFIRSGQIETEEVPSVILESWNRCLKAEVEFAGGRCQKIISGRELEKRQDHLLEVAAPLFKTMYHCLRSLGFVIVLTDPDGYILSFTGDIEAIRTAEKINFGPGADWSELSVGTNAIGTALAMGRALQVTGPEHFNDGHHLWTCAASPIWSPDGRLVGCLDISGPRENANYQILDITLSAAKFIEERLRQETAHHHALKANRVLNQAFDQVSDGIVSVSSEGFIDGINSSASRIFGLRRADLLGRHIQDILPLRFSAQAPDTRHPDKAFPFSTRLGNFRCLVSPKSPDNNPASGAVLTLSKVPRRSSSGSKAQPGLKVRYSFKDVVGQNPRLLEILGQARLASAGKSTVLVLGESGTGKEIFAQAIHQAGPRCFGPFVSINCGAIPKELIQSELFGYVDGAFTGARKNGAPGKIELADGGTLFLDEIGDMPLDMQANLLRVLEDQAFLPLGSDRPVFADVRFIMATNRKLEREVREGRFREDLYYRLNVVTLALPPLRERLDDIPLIGEYHLFRLAQQLNKPVPPVDPAVWAILKTHRWAGNIRELVNVLEYALNFMSGDRLTPQDLPPYLRPGPSQSSQGPVHEIVPLSLVEKQAIDHALARYQGNISRVAQALGIGRNTLYNKMKKYGLTNHTRNTLV